MDQPEQTFDGWTVLVVEDEQDSLELAALLLRHYGATVVTANNGQEGLERIAAHPEISFVLTDISMPVMDGWAFIATLKADRRTMELPIIALTAHAMIGDRERAIAAGCHNYLVKPLDPRNFFKNLVSILVDIPVFADRF